MAAEPVLLFETASRSFVEAVVRLDLTGERLQEVEDSWGPHRTALRAEHSHWDWGLKADFLAEPGVRCLEVGCAGRAQGLMLIREAGQLARLDPDRGAPLVYVDYLESAPWNLPAAGTPRYTGVGKLLLRAAVRRSLALGYGGRIGLHSLPQGESFYRRKCGLVGCGPDPEYYGLVYFELAAGQAAAFAEG